MADKMADNGLKKRISQLPQVLQDYIGMYNVEHRMMMKAVCEELIVVWEEMDSIECASCCGAYVSISEKEFASFPWDCDGDPELFCSFSCQYDYESLCRYYKRHG